MPSKSTMIRNSLLFLFNALVVMYFTVLGFRNCLPLYDPPFSSISANFE